MSPGNAERRPGQGGATAAIAQAPRQHEHPEDNRLPRVRARALAPCGRRTLPVMVVPAGGCPWCPGSHVHRGGDGPRTAGCCSREYYLLAVQGVSVGRAA